MEHVIPKREQERLNARLDRSDRCLQVLDFREMEAQQEPVVLGHAAVQAGQQAVARRLEAAGRVREQALGIRLASHQRPYDRPATGAEQIRDDPGELEIRILQGLLQAQRVLRDLADQLLASPREIAQSLDGRGRHEARPYEPVRQ
jgi:hypothetical protein